MESIKHGYGIQSKPHSTLSAPTSTSDKVQLFIKCLAIGGATAVVHFGICLTFLVGSLLVAGSLLALSAGMAANALLFCVGTLCLAGMSMLLALALFLKHKILPELLRQPVSSSASR